MRKMFKNLLEENLQALPLNLLLLCAKVKKPKLEKQKVGILLCCMPIIFFIQKALRSNYGEDSEFEMFSYAKIVERIVWASDIRNLECSIAVLMQVPLKFGVDIVHFQIC